MGWRDIFGARKRKGEIEKQTKEPDKPKSDVSEKGGKFRYTDSWGSEHEFGSKQEAEDFAVKHKKWRQDFDAKKDAKRGGFKEQMA